MATFRGDRERRMAGDRIGNRKDGFCVIHPAVAEVHGKFCEKHVSLQSAIAARGKEEGEASQAREAREEAGYKLAGHYTWAYGQLDAKLAPSWDVPADEEIVEAVRKRLFPLGPPAHVKTSLQQVIDAMTTFLNRVSLEQGLDYPASFITAAKQSLQAVNASAKKVNTEADEATAAVNAHHAARAAWDTHHQALKEITTGFLRLQGKVGQLTVLFQELPPNAAAGEYESSSTVAVTPPVTEPA